MPHETRQFNFANNARSTLAAALSSSATELLVQPLHGGRFPAAGAGEIFACILFSADLASYEIAYVTSKGGDVFTIERAKEGTAARDFPAGAVIVHNVTAAFFQQRIETAVVYEVFAASGTFNVPADVTEVDVLLVGGGGGGGGYFSGGGGGAGGVLEVLGHAVTPLEAIPVVVGDGGAGGVGGAGGSVPAHGSDGADSTFDTVLVAEGGGGGGNYDGTVYVPGNPGGSGGGGGGRELNAGGSGTAGQGNAGGRARDGSTAGFGSGGGGGGAGTAGVNGESNVDGDGGAGISLEDLGWRSGDAPVLVAGGGGGGQSVDEPLLNGSTATHGGGAGGRGIVGDPSPGEAGLANTGGGGGGAGNDNMNADVGGAGGSGMVIVRYRRV